MSVWNWIQRFGSYQIYKRKSVSAFIIAKTVIQIGNQYYWLRICIVSIDKSVLGIFLSEEGNVLVAEKFICLFVKDYGNIIYILMMELYRNECNLFHIYNWIQFFLSRYNGTIFENYFINKLNDRSDRS